MPATTRSTSTRTSSSASRTSRVSSSGPSLHSYPFYNSEQSSQRYVKLKEPRAFVPPISGEALDVYERAILSAWDSYAELSALLKDDAFRILKELRYVTPRASAERLKAIEKDAEKRAIETARYVIPLAAFTSMVHTVSGITLHRLRRMAASGDAPHEAREVIGRNGRSRAPGGSVLLREGRLRGTAELTRCRRRISSARRLTAIAFAREFDRRLNGRVSRLRRLRRPARKRASPRPCASTFGLSADELTTTRRSIGS